MITVREASTILLEAFGLPLDGCRGIEIRCFVNEPIIIKAEYFAELNEGTKELNRVIKTFKLVEK